MNKKVLITGATKGIGKETAYLLAENGYDLLLLARSKDLLESIKEDIESKYKVNVYLCPMDVGNENDMPKLKSLIDEIDGVDVLINNAAISKVGLITDLSYEEWNQLMDVNLNSVFYLSKAVIPHMVHNKEGRIINISSMWGQVGASMEVAYSTSKGGVNAFTKALAKELAPSNIKVNAVSFGVIDTDMNRCFSKEEMEALKNEIPMDRIASPKEAAKMIYNTMLAPDYMTGQIISMDGGYI